MDHHKANINNPRSHAAVKSRRIKALLLLLQTEKEPRSSLKKEASNNMIIETVNKLLTRSNKACCKMMI